MNDLAQGGGQQAGHAALLHASNDEFVAGVLGFVNAGLDEDEPVLVSATGSGIRSLRERMNGRAHRVNWADTAREGANPARIMPVLRAFADAHAGRPVRFLQELAWAARTSAEQREAIRHEALINVAFAAARVRVLCSYDSAQLDPAIIRSAMSTHPVFVTGGTARPSPAYDAGSVFPDEWNQPLRRPPDGAAALVVLASGADFDVLFTDVQMPGPIDGVGVAVRVHEQRPGTPIVMTSGHGIPELLPAGGRFVSKPYDNRKVVTLLSQLAAA